MKVKRVLATSAIAAMFILNGCGGGGNGNDGKKSPSVGGPSKKESPLHIYPEKPVVASDDGILQLTAVVEQNKQILENSDEHTLVATYKSSNEDVATVSEDGYLVGGQPGEAEITVTITDENTTKTYKNKVKVEVKSVDISKLFINPSVATIGKNKEKEFFITALDKAKSPTELEGKYFSLDYSNSLITANPIITQNDAKIKVRAKNEKGYTFITPKFTKAGITVTGDPALIQINSIPQINIPDGLTAGDEIDFLRVKNGSGDNMYIVHTDEDAKLYLDYFNVKNGMWNREDLDYEGNSIKAPKVMKIGKTLTIYSIVDDNKFVKFTSEDDSSWVTQNIEPNGFDLSSSIDFDNIDYVHDGTTVYALIGNKDEIVLAKNSEDSQEFTKIASFKAPNGGNIESVDLALNKNNKLRFTFATDNGDLYYGTVNSDKIELAKPYHSDSLVASKIDYTKNNVPVIMYQKDDKLVELQKTRGGMWASNPISTLTFQQNGLKDSDALSNMEHFDFKVDRFGNSRVVVSANEKLYYIKEYHVKKSSYWRVDSIVNKYVGSYVSMQIDNKNRLKVAYTDDNQNWVKYFAEPVYIKYNDGKDKSRFDDSIKDTRVVETIDLATGKVTIPTKDSSTSTAGEKDGGATTQPSGTGGKNNSNSKGGETTSGSSSSGTPSNQSGDRGNLNDNNTTNVDNNGTNTNSGDTQKQGASDSNNTDTNSTTDDSANF